MQKGPKQANQEMGRRIRELRGAMTQTEFGEKFGVAQGQVAKYEQGMMPGPVTLLNLSRAAGVTVEWVLLGDKPHPKTADAEASPYEIKTVNADHQPDLESSRLLAKARALREEMDAAPARELGMQATRKINDQDQAEFAAGHLLDTTLPAYAAGVLGDLVRDAVGNKDLREKIVEYYLFLKFMDSHGKLNDVKKPDAKKPPNQKK